VAVGRTKTSLAPVVHRVVSEGGILNGSIADSTIDCSSATRIGGSILGEFVRIALRKLSEYLASCNGGNDAGLAACLEGLVRVLKKADCLPANEKLVISEIRLQVSFAIDQVPPLRPYLNGPDSTSLLGAQPAVPRAQPFDGSGAMKSCSGSRTVSTGHGACRTTRSAVLPSRTCFKPV